MFVEPVRLSTYPVIPTALPTGTNPGRSSGRLLRSADEIFVRVSFAAHAGASLEVRDSFLGRVTVDGRGWPFLTPVRRVGEVARIGRDVFNALP